MCVCVCVCVCVCDREREISFWDFQGTQQEITQGLRAKEKNVHRQEESQKINKADEIRKASGTALEGVFKTKDI